MVPGKIWKFYDYVDHRGANIVVDALASYPVDARAAFDLFVANVEVTLPPIDRHFVKPLRNINGEDGRGLHEFRFKSGNVQYRPLVRVDTAGREITIFVMAIEQANRFRPEGAVATCWNRISKLETGDAKRIIRNSSKQAGRAKAPDRR